MNVTTIGQALGNVATLPAPQTGGEAPLLSLRDSAPATAAAEPSGNAGKPDDVRFARIAWFDLNGDGHIDNRSPLAGGDGTLLVPHHAVDLPTYSRSSARPEVKLGEVRPPRLHGADDSAAKSDTTKTAGSNAQPGAQASGQAQEPVVAVAPQPTDAQTRQAIDAYQRYGSSADASAPTERAVA